jgi:hypothetical protein
MPRYELNLTNPVIEDYQLEFNDALRIVFGLDVAIDWRDDNTVWIRTTVKIHDETWKDLEGFNPF